MFEDDNNVERKKLRTESQNNVISSLTSISGSLALIWSADFLCNILCSFLKDNKVWSYLFKYFLPSNLFKFERNLVLSTHPDLFSRFLIRKVKTLKKIQILEEKNKKS